jgi:hypothetical protein
MSFYVFTRGSLRSILRAHVDHSLESSHSDRLLVVQFCVSSSLARVEFHAEPAGGWRRC